MKRVLWCLIFILLLSVVQAETLHYAQGLTLEQQIQSGISIEPTSSTYSLQSAYIDLYLFAQNDQQQQVLQNFYGPYFYNQQGNKLHYEWNNPTQTTLPLRVIQEIQTRPSNSLVDRKVNFPLRKLSPDVASYVAFTEHIDRSPEIASIAQTLAAGEDDLFMLQHKIASWVTGNIQYNLSSITLEANIPSSIVIEQGYGVCDEITNLFLSINRELGIPARFVSGIAYSESILFDTKWGNHGWAEVYFPDIGWVPYDVTYQQFGWIDPTHIALSKEVDGATPALKTQAIGYGYNFNTLPLVFDTKVIEELPRVPPRTQIEVNMFANEVGIGSFNVVEAVVQNPHEYYISEKLTLTPTSDLQLLEVDAVKHIALAPGQTKKVTWTVQVNENLAQNYRYTFPVGVTDSVGYDYDQEFTVQENFEFISRELLPIKEEFILNPPSVVCVGPGEVLINEQVHIECYLPTTATRVQQVCLEDICAQATFSQNASFSVATSELGVFTVQMQAGGNEEVIVSYRVTDIPAAKILNATVRGQDNYATPVQISFLAKKDSYNIPRNVTILVAHELFQEQWELPALQREQPVSLAVPAQVFAWGTNEINIQIRDSNGILDEQIITVNMRPTRIDDAIFAGINYGNRYLARNGIRDAILRSGISMILASMLIFGTLHIIFRLARKLIMR